MLLGIGIPLWIRCTTWIHSPPCRCKVKEWSPVMCINWACYLCQTSYLFACCCFTTVIGITVINRENKQSNKQRSHFLKNLFENPNVSLLKLNSLYNSSTMCPVRNATKIFNRCDENYTKPPRIWACFLNNALEFNILLLAYFERTRTPLTSL